MTPRTAALVAMLAAHVACGPDSETTSSPEPRRPNFLLVLADDVGFTDLGFMGSEIRTPNLDALAADGLVLTNFHVAPNCSPTRSMLLSGTDTHPAGFGTMAGDADENQQGRPGYEGHLSTRIVTIASLLRDAGYHTYVAGKWHMGGSPELLPPARGFEQSFIVVEGGASHFSDRAPNFAGGSATYREDGELVDELPEGFFSSEAHTDKLIEYIGAGLEDDAPFFAYAAYTAPHWPLQVPDEDLDLYRGVYDDGYETLREARTDAVAEAGFLPGGIALERPSWVPAWDSLAAADRAVEIRRMEIYAAMIENLDRHVGRLFDFLRESGEAENTYVVFFSDNGPEGNQIGTMYDNENWIPDRFDNSLENMGRVDSYVWLGPGWAQASSGPFRLFKGMTTEGGVRTPAIVSHPTLGRSGRSDAPVTVKDIAPTLLELAGVEHPDTYRGREVAAMQGTSMTGFLSGAAATVHGEEPVMGWELFGRRALLAGDWKLVWMWEPFGGESWELYDLGRDPSEARDLASAEPDKLAEMLRLWEDYVRVNDVVLPARDMGYGLPDGTR